MASWKAFRPLASQAATSGRVSASPRSACGSTLPCAVHFSRPWSLGKLPGDQSGDGHDVPFQALGLVRGEHLDGVLAAGQRVVEALLVLGGGAQEAEEGEQGGLAVAAAAKDGGDVEEVGQGLAAAGGQGVRGRGQLDLQAGDGEDPVQDVHERVGQRAAQVAQFGGEPGEAHARVGREGQRRRPGPSSGVSRKVSRASASEITSAGSTPSTASASRRSGSSSPSPARVGDEQPGAAPQQGEVAGADAPARAGQQPYQGGVGAGVLEDLADGDQVGDLGQVQQPGEADHLDGDVPGDQGALDLGEVGRPYGTARRSRRAACRCARGGRGSRRASRSPRRGWAAARSGPCRRARRRGRGAAPRRPRAWRAAARRGRWRGRAGGRRCGGSR